MCVTNIILQHIYELNHTFHRTALDKQTNVNARNKKPRRTSVFRVLLCIFLISLVFLDCAYNRIHLGIVFAVVVACTFTIPLLCVCTTKHLSESRVCVHTAARHKAHTCIHEIRQFNDAHRTDDRIIRTTETDLMPLHTIGTTMERILTFERARVRCNRMCSRLDRLTNTMHSEYSNVSCMNQLKP